MGQVSVLIVLGGGLAGLACKARAASCCWCCGTVGSPEAKPAGSHQALQSFHILRVSIWTPPALVDVSGSRTHTSRLTFVVNSGGFLGTQIGSRNQDLFWTDLSPVNSYGFGLLGLLIVVIFEEFGRNRNVLLYCKSVDMSQSL